MNVVSDEDDASSALFGTSNIAEDNLSLFDAKCRCRFIENENLGAEVNRPCDRDGLAFSAGEGNDRAIKVADVDADVADFPRSDIDSRSLVQPRERPRPISGSRPKKKCR